MQFNRREALMTGLSLVPGLAAIRKITPDGNPIEELIPRKHLDPFVVIPDPVQRITIPWGSFQKFMWISPVSPAWCVKKILISSAGAFKVAIHPQAREHESFDANGNPIVFDSKLELSPIDVRPELIQHTRELDFTNVWISEVSIDPGKMGDQWSAIIELEQLPF